MPVKPVFEEVIEISRTVEESGAGQSQVPACRRFMLEILIFLKSSACLNECSKRVVIPRITFSWGSIIVVDKQGIWECVLCRA